jgi:hypothetical protein
MAEKGDAYNTKKEASQEKSTAIEKVSSQGQGKGIASKSDTKTSWKKPRTNA